MRKIGRHSCCSWAPVRIRNRLSLRRMIATDLTPPEIDIDTDRRPTGIRQSFRPEARRPRPHGTTVPAASVSLRLVRTWPALRRSGIVQSSANFDLVRRLFHATSFPPCQAMRIWLSLTRRRLFAESTYLYGWLPLCSHARRMGWSRKIILLQITTWLCCYETGIKRANATWRNNLIECRILAPPMYNRCKLFLTSDSIIDLVVGTYTSKRLYHQMNVDAVKSVNSWTNKNENEYTQVQNAIPNSLKRLETSAIRIKRT